MYRYGSHHVSTQYRKSGSLAPAVTREAVRPPVPVEPPARVLLLPSVEACLPASRRAVLPPCPSVEGDAKAVQLALGVPPDGLDPFGDHFLKTIPSWSLCGHFSSSLRCFRAAQSTRMLSSSRAMVGMRAFVRHHLRSWITTTDCLRSLRRTNMAAYRGNGATSCKKFPRTAAHPGPT